MLDRKPSDRKLIGTLTAAFSLACTVALVGGILLKENRLLTIGVGSGEPYLKTGAVDAITAIDVQLANGDITSEEAYHRLRNQLQLPSPGVR